MKKKYPNVPPHEDKYHYHDIHQSDLTDTDILYMRSAAINRLVLTSQIDGTRAMIDAFLTYLTSHGFKVVKSETIEFLETRE